MRKDMYKVIVERPRRGSGNKYHSIRNSKKIEQLFNDNETATMGIRKPHTIRHGWDRKELNENLNPLKSFIRSKVGQPWDTVYSEICIHLKGNSTVKQHVRDHLHQYVELDHRYRRGLERPSRYGLYQYIPEFYVNINGILCQNKRIPQIKNRWHIKQQEELDSRYRKDDSGFEIWKINGIWYSMIWSQIPLDRIYNRINSEGNPYVWIQKYDARDIATGQLVRGAGTWYRSGKKQANSKILKRFSVQND